LQTLPSTIPDVGVPDMSIVEDSKVGIGVTKLLDQSHKLNKIANIFHLCQEQCAHSWMLAVTYCKVYSQFRTRNQRKKGKYPNPAIVPSI